ncbi:folate-binding protein YgfZ [Gordonia desulfuricans]|uniref:Folate-binding protein YgfZ n=1 Tax=Gordonia desulfuricans TaxID=89051 RepID=A0A7K3LKE9_9ACTN|nr:folate-binding protein YgfZ [Gordonia desulfuricans]NDK88749.1 folate-binding protein YgfZ [Gordonia desulfuricans]
MTRSPILTRYSGEGAVGSAVAADPAGTGSPESDSSPHETPGYETPWHYGDPLGEQRAAITGAIVVDRSDRAVLELTGPERLSWLHTICSQYLTNLADRHSAEALSLDTNGRVEDHFVLTDIDDVTWVDTEPARGRALLDFLTKMVFWAKVEPADRPDLRVLTLIGPDAVRGPIADVLGVPADAAVYQAGDLPETHHDDEPLGFWRIMPPLSEGPHSDALLPVVDVVVPEPDLLTWWAELVAAGARMAGSWAFDALRVAGLRPRLGVDTDERTIPHEAHWIGGPAEFGAVHLDKGCYRGQETVARVHNLGKPPRQLVLLHLDGSSDHRPAPGGPITAGGRTVGRLGTVVDHFDLGPVALGLVKRGIGADIDLVVGDEDAMAARIDPDSVAADEHVQAGRAAVERLRGRA